VYPVPQFCCALLTVTVPAAAEASAETAARVSKDELSRFERAIAYICHELRNPLHVVGGVLHQMEAGIDTAALALEMVSLRSAVDIMFAVTNDLLDLAALRQGKLRVAATATSIRDVLGACVSAAALAGAWLSIADAVPSVVMVDALRLRQIVVNGLINAKKYAASAPAPAAACELRRMTLAFAQICERRDGATRGVRVHRRHYRRARSRRN
jgi:signal transduction histidine kinase